MRPQAQGSLRSALIDGEATVMSGLLRDGHAWRSPHNPAYSPIPADEAPIRGRVVAVLRKVCPRSAIRDPRSVESPSREWG